MIQEKGLAFIFSLKKCRHYLLGCKAKIVTDHKVLTYLVNKSNPSGRFVRWLLLMEEFDIVHCPGRRHGNVDGLKVTNIHLYTIQKEIKQEIF